MIELFLKDESETQRLASFFVPKLTPGTLIFLWGDLASGKSTFARSLIRLHSKMPTLEVPSPTFSIVQFYDDLSLKIAHADLYRIKSEEDFLELGINEFMISGVLLIEWPGIAKEFLPEPTYDLEFMTVRNSRQIRLKTQNKDLKNILKEEFQ